MILVSKLRLTDRSGGISDVYAHKGFAYLGGWIPECPHAGVHVVSIKDPAHPKKVAFIPAGRHDYVAEGVFVFHMETKSFRGDVLVMSNEPCGWGRKSNGGISLWDVTNPRRPRLLVVGAGERSRKGHTHSAHSAMAWQRRGRAYAVLVDNQDRRDVDILEITNPRRPRLIGETGLPDWPEARDPQATEPSATYGVSFHHDMWVKEIDGRVYMLVSYWDAGFVLLDVTDPSTSTYVDDSTYTEPDPLFGTPHPEGNAHQAMWSSDNRYILAADEDFRPRRFLLEIAGGPNAGMYEGVESYWTASFKRFAGRTAIGPAVFGGSGCPGSDPIPPASRLELTEEEEAIVALRQGDCRAYNKARAAADAGYDVVILATSHQGSEFGDEPDALVCPGSGVSVGGVVGGCVSHRTFHLMFDTEPSFEDGGIEPELGRVGRHIRVGLRYDGLGYLHLLDARTLEEIDAYTIEEAMHDVPEGERRSRELSVHEIKPDPRTGVALGYASWYGGGARVIGFGPDGLVELGHWERGPETDFWGTFPLAREGRRPLLLFSDRNLGLIILRFTGAE